MFPAISLRLTVLIVMLSSVLALAAPHPRALELLELNDRYLAGDRPLDETPRTMSMTMTMRFPVSAAAGLEEESVSETSIAVDFERELMRFRSCIDANLASEAVLRDGMLTSWNGFSNEVTTVDAGELGLAQLLGQFNLDPTKLFEIDQSNISYDGEVDYGVLKGEQVTLTVEGVGMTGAPGIGNQMNVVFAPNGLMLGQRMHTPNGPMIGVFDGFIRLERGRMLRGMTMFQPDAAGDWQKVGVVRLWNVRVNEPFDDGMFELVPPGDPVTAAERAALEARSDEIMARIAEIVARPAEKYDVDEVERLFAERDSIRDRLWSTAVSVPCPEPF